MLDFSVQINNWVKSFIPQSISVNNAERLRASIGAFFGIILTCSITYLIEGEASSIPFLIAPIGASAVLLFAVPSSPLAQPWSIMGGNMLAAFIGITSAIDQRLSIPPI